MAENNESTMKWKVDVTQLKAAMQEAKRAINQANAEFKTATAGMDKWSKSTDGLEAKLKQLNSLLPAQKRQLEVLQASYDDTVKKMGANSQAAADLKIKIEEQKAAITKTETSISRYTSQLSTMQAAENSLTNTINKQEAELRDLKAAYVEVVAQQGENSDEAKDLAKQISSLSGELVENKSKLQEASEAADKLDKSLEDVEKEAKDADGGFTILKGTIANLAAEGVKALINGFQKLGSELINVGKQAYNAYSEYEQLTGGVETLFGKSAKEVKKYAENAYKTAGMSANTYMSTVTSFSASLLQGLNGDTEKAAKIADQAIIDMADNANKMGTSMEMIQNAYQGFAKSNFTMLDNLKLGYGGTKTEMLRLVQDAGVVEESVKSIDDVSFDKIIEAIHIVQDRMGITGTTAKEAEDTIEGSTLSMKASWENLMVAIADDNANINKSIKQFTDSAEKMIKNAAPRIKQIIKGLLTSAKKLLKQYMPEIYDTVAPVITKLTKTVKSFVTFVSKNFKTIAPIVMTAVAAFTAFNAAMAISKTVSAVSAAMQTLTAGVGLATKAQVLYNAALSSNPIMAVVTAVLALVAALALLVTMETDEQKAHKARMEALEEQRNEIDANIDSWNSLKEAQQKQMDAGMTEMSYLQSLKNELKEITDSNGKVKEGYEERASFIKDQLSEALGIEIEMSDGVIEKYGEIMNAIDDLMEKKKAQIILDSQESLYSEAIANQAEALREFNDIQDIYNKKLEERNKLQEQIDYWQAILDEEKLKGVTDLYIEANDNLYELNETMKGVNEEFTIAEDNYTKQKDLISQYAYNIGVYEENMALAHAGRYEEMTTVNWNYVRDYQSASDAQRQMLEDSIANEETNLALLKELKEKSGTDIYDQQIKQAEERLAAQKQELKKYVSAIEEGNDKAAVKWSEGLDDQLSELTEHNIEFKHVAGGLVQMYVDGIAEGKPMSKEAAAELATDAINEISMQETHAKEAGEDLIDGVNNGIANEKKQSGVFSTISNFGNKLLGKLRASLKEHSPSKASDEMGQFLLEGLGLGIKKKEASTLAEVASFGKSVLDTLNDELAEGASLTGVKQSIADELNALKGSVAVQANAMGNGSTSAGSFSSETKNQTVTFNQTINSPKAVDGMTLYRETNSLLFSAKVRLGNV